MYIIAFILLLISLIKLLTIGSATWEELKELVTNTNISIIKVAILILLLESILEAICSLYILL